MQLLLDVHQKLYGLHPVEEGYLKISSKTFDPEQAEVVMKLGTDACESAAWGPANDQDPQWVEHQKQFVKVSNFYHFYFIHVQITNWYEGSYLLCIGHSAK